MPSELVVLSVDRPASRFGSPRRIEQRIVVRMAARLATMCSLLTVLVFGGCPAHVGSDIQIDGAPFAAKTCRSGQASGFAGVELVDDHERRLRLAQKLDGTFAGAYFTPASSVGDNLTACATLNLETGVGVVNGVRNIKGSATLACRTERHQVTGSVSFENCH